MMVILKGNKEPALLIFKGAFAFFLGGILSGLLYLYVGSLVVVIFGSALAALILWLLIKPSVSLTKLVIAIPLGDFVSFFISAVVGLLIYDAYGVPNIIGGIVMGLIVGAVIGGVKGAVIFAIVGAVVFVIGDAAVESFNIWDGAYYRALGEDAGMVGIVALKSLYKGIAVGLGLGIYRKTSNSGS